MERRDHKEKKSAQSVVAAKNAPLKPTMIPAIAPSLSMVVVDGTIKIGAIDDVAAAAIKRPAGPIHLPEGIPGRKGFGLLHIESNPGRVTMIKGLGFTNAINFIADVARNWTAILQGDDDRIILIREKDGYGQRIIVEQIRHKNAVCWSVITAIPARKIGPKEIVLFRK